MAALAYKQVRVLPVTSPPSPQFPQRGQLRRDLVAPIQNDSGSSQRHRASFRGTLGFETNRCSSRSMRGGTEADHGASRFPKRPAIRSSECGVRAKHLSRLGHASSGGFTRSVRGELVTKRRTSSQLATGPYTHETGNLGSECAAAAIGR
jgi:hypothetical protein